MTKKLEKIKIQSKNNKKGKISIHSSTFDKNNKKNVFIVLGRNKSINNEVKKHIVSLGMNPISIEHQSLHSENFIEILNDYTSKCEHAIVIYSPDDKGKLNKSNEKFTSRARQNVLVEHGYLISKYGNDRITIIYTPKIEKPSDIASLK